MFAVLVLHLLKGASNCLRTLMIELTAQTYSYHRFHAAAALQTSMNPLVICDDKTEIYIRPRAYTTDALLLSWQSGPVAYLAVQ